MNIDKVSVNGVSYVREDQVTVAPKPGKRYVIVIDRGWIVAGDVEDVNGRIKITRAIHVFSWKQGGFTKVCSDPKGADADLRPLPNGFDIPADSEIFRVPVADDWGV